LKRGWQRLTNEVVESNYRLQGSGSGRRKTFGAGAGGFCAELPQGKQQQVREALSALREMRLKLTTGGSEVVHNAGATARAAS